MADDFEDGVEDDLEVESPIEGFDIFDVVADPLLEVFALLTATADLP